MQQQPISKGLIHEKASIGKFTISRHPPSDNLSNLIQHYWIARWDLRGSDPYNTETLPYPGVNLVFDGAGTKIFGVFSGKSDKTLEGAGKVCAILFRPGGFYPFYQSPLTPLTDSFLDFNATFGPDSRNFEKIIVESDDDPIMIKTTEDFLFSLNPKPDHRIDLINRIIDQVIDDRSITRVRQVCQIFNMSERSLQNLFSIYVGVGLKWVIMRYRLQDAVHRISTGKVIDWLAVALDLGYVDQAHFINDFRKIIGKSPADYAKQDG